MSDPFFDEKKAPAVLKHGILRRYLAIFASKTGSTAPDNRVAFIDGYAGPGVYTDGSAGSPALAATTAAALPGRTLHGVYIEKDAKQYRALKDHLGATRHTHDVLHGSAEERLEQALSIAGPVAPLFAFFDPFGLPIGVEQLRAILTRSSGRSSRRKPPTELLISFMYPGLWRAAGHLTSRSRNEAYRHGSRQTAIATMDRTLGGDWWQAEWKSASHLTSEARAARIAHGFLDRLTRGLDGKWGWHRVKVRRSWKGPVVYELQFITLYAPEGMWAFNDATSSAIEEYLRFCRRGELPLNEVEIYERGIVSELKKSILGLLDGGRAFSISAKHAEILADQAGQAREKHIRRAIKELYREGLTATSGVGDLREMTLHPPLPGRPQRKAAPKPARRPKTGRLL